MMALGCVSDLIGNFCCHFDLNQISLKEIKRTAFSNDQLDFYYFFFFLFFLSPQTCKVSCFYLIF